MLRQVICSTVAASLTLAGSSASSQVVRFRLETTDLAGATIESVLEGTEFLLKAYTQHVGGFESAANSGVFAGYLDIAYEPSLASVAGEIAHGDLYANGKSGDLSVPGLLDNIGGFSSSGDLGIGLDPIGPDEQFLFSLPMRADAPGLLDIVGSESLQYPAYDVLVYAQDVPVPARDIDFGAADLRIEFGAVSLNVTPVPEPGSFGLCILAALGLLRLLRPRFPSPCGRRAECTAAAQVAL